MRRIKFAGFLGLLVAFGIMLGLAITPHKAKAKTTMDGGADCQTIVFNVTNIDTSCGQELYPNVFYFYDNQGNLLSQVNAYYVTAGNCGGSPYYALGISGIPTGTGVIYYTIGANPRQFACDDFTSYATSWVTGTNTATACFSIYCPNPPNDDNPGS